MKTAFPDSSAEKDDCFWLPFLLQTSDALFPTGAYAHSLGFEEIVRLGLVQDEKSLGDFLLQQLAPNLALLELPYLRFAFEAADLAELCLLDLEISAWKMPQEARQASLQLGLRRLKALQAVDESPILDDFSEAVSDGRAAGNHLVVCALQARSGQMPLEVALLVYGYQTFAACCGSALKLIRIGQDGCQRALRRAAARLPENLAVSYAVERADAGSFQPLLEIAAMRHEFADERLFIS